MELPKFDVYLKTVKTVQVGHFWLTEK